VLVRVSSPRRKRIGIMGGMFDPVHLGHLRLAQAAQVHAVLDEIRLVPCGSPVHRPQAFASAEQRLAMLALAVAGEPGLLVDPRECRSPARSYSYDTLAAMRAEQPAATLFLVMGIDAFLQLHTWYRWQELFALAHLLVAGRPGYRLEIATLNAGLRAEASPRLQTCPEACADSTAGCILLAELDTPAISSTRVRALLLQTEGGSATGEAAEEAAALLLPAVSNYIRKHRLYRQEETN